MKRQTDTGFTLLEVLAAVAILGIWFAVLANVAIQGLRAEGENERRIRASLLADRTLTEIELNLDIDVLPDETADEFEEDEFAIRVEAVPFADLEVGGESDTNLVDVIAGELPSLAPDLYGIYVTVTWTEGAVEKVVRRTTYFWDSGPINEKLSGQAQATEEELEDEDGPASGSGASARQPTSGTAAPSASNTAGTNRRPAKRPRRNRN